MRRSSSDARRAWENALPERVMSCEDEWGLMQTGQPFEHGRASIVLPARKGRADVVLKLQFPHRESEYEAEALELWDGDGAIRLVASSVEHSALLIERCVPGTHLSAEDAKRALNVLIGLLPRLWKPAGEPFHTLADEAAWWCSYLPAGWELAGRPCEQRLLDAGVSALRELAPTQGEQVLLHQDLHADNVLAAEREPWLVIDPKPLVGEREFAVAPIVRSSELGHSRREVLARFDRLTGELGLDRERARGWTIGQTLAWAFDESRYHVRHLEVARWLLEAA